MTIWQIANVFAVEGYVLHKRENLVNLLSILAYWLFFSQWFVNIDNIENDAIRGQIDHI